MDNGATLVNSGTFFALNDAGIITTTSAVFNNKGTFVRDSGGATFTIGSGITFNNTGAVDVLRGTLDLQGGDGGNTTGSFAVSSNAHLQFDANYTLASTASFSGSGTVSFSSGTISLGGTSNVTGLTSFNGSSLTGAGKAVFNGPINWSTGQLSGTGTLFANGGLTIDGGAIGAVQLSQHTLNNGGTAVLPARRRILRWIAGRPSSTPGPSWRRTTRASTTPWQRRLVYQQWHVYPQYRDWHVYSRERCRVQQLRHGQCADRDAFLARRRHGERQFRHRPGAVLQFAGTHLRSHDPSSFGGAGILSI